MLDNLKKYDVVLASNSPRRKELLQRLGIPFKVRNLFGVDESYPSTMTDGEEIASFIAKKKAEAYRSSHVSKRTDHRRRHHGLFQW